MKKKYSLKYFIKINSTSLRKVFEKYLNSGELPFEYEGKNWIYDYEVEYNKRFGVHNFEFHTSDEIAKEFIEFMKINLKYEDKNFLDACCGFGQLSKALKENYNNFENINLDCFDRNPVFVKIANHLGFNAKRYNFLYDFLDDDEIFKKEIKNKENLNYDYDVIFSNPPFGIIPGEFNFKSEISHYFLEWAFERLNYNGVLACILPINFWEKPSKKLIELKDKFQLISEEENNLSFYNTGTRTKFYLFQKLY